MRSSHAVEATLADDIFAILRRWKATKPAGASGCVFIELHSVSAVTAHRGCFHQTRDGRTEVPAASAEGTSLRCLAA